MIILDCPKLTKLEFNQYAFHKNCLHFATSLVLKDCPSLLDDNVKVHKTALFNLTSCEVNENLEKKIAAFKKNKIEKNKEKEKAN